MQVIILCLLGGLPDLNIPKPSLTILIQIDIDREMCIHISHLVLVPLRHADDQIVDDGADGPECSDVLARAVVEFDVDDVLFWVRERDGEMAEILGEFAARAFDCYYASFDVDFDCMSEVC